MKDIPFRKRWRGKIWAGRSSKQRARQETPTHTIRSAKPDGHVQRFEREIAEVDGLIAELQAQLSTLQKQRTAAVRKLERRKRALET